MTAREKIRKLVEVKEQAQERYRTDPEYRSIHEKLRKENAERRADKQL